MAILDCSRRVASSPWLPGVAGIFTLLLLLSLAPFAFPQMDDWWLATVSRDGGSDRHPFMGRVLAGLVGPGLFMVVDPVRHYAIVPVISLAAIAAAVAALAWAAGARGGAWIASIAALTAAVALRLPDPAQGLFWWAAVSAHTLGAVAGLLAVAFLAMLSGTRHPAIVMVAAIAAAGLAAGFSETALVMVVAAVLLVCRGPRGRWAWSAIVIGAIVVGANLFTSATGHRLEQGGGLRVVSIAGGLAHSAALCLEWGVG
jgi:hypothetical protein